MYDMIYPSVNPWCTISTQHFFGASSSSSCRAAMMTWIPRRWIVREFQGCAGKHLRWAKSYRCCEIKVWCRRMFFQKIPSYHSHGKWPYYRGKDRLVETHSTISWRVFQLCWDHFFRDAIGVSSLRFFAVSLRKRSSITQRSLIVERKGLVSDEVIRPKDATVGVPSTRGMAKNAWGEPQRCFENHFSG